MDTVVQAVHYRWTQCILDTLEPRGGVENAEILKWLLSSGLSEAHKYQYLFSLGELYLVVWVTLTKGEIDCMMIETIEEKGFKLL